MLSLGEKITTTVRPWSKTQRLALTRHSDGYGCGFSACSKRKAARLLRDRPSSALRCSKALKTVNGIVMVSRLGERLRKA